jgi:hypothetical protein
MDDDIIVSRVVCWHSLVSNIKLFGFRKEIFTIDKLSLQSSFTLEEQTFRYPTIWANALQLNDALVFFSQCLVHLHHATHCADLIAQELSLYI